MNKSELHSETKTLLELNGTAYDGRPFHINGRSYFVRNNVFNPRVFPSTSWYAQNLPVTNGDHILEIGTGAGVIAIEATYKGAGWGVATDISKDACKLARKNARQHHAPIIVLQSDVFEQLHMKYCQKGFDTLFWSMPFGYTEQEPTAIERTTFDCKYQSIERYFAGAERFLKPKGKLLFGFSKILGSEKHLDKILRTYGYTKKLLSETTLKEVREVDFGIYQAVR